jgi:type IV pilus assembly protein PilV
MLLRDDCRGFTLIETLIAIVILSVGIMGLYAMVVGTIHGTTFNKHLMTATVLAQDMMEKIRNADYDSVIAANYPLESYSTIADYRSFERSVTISADGTPDPHTKTVTVTVSWHNSSGYERNVQMSTIIMR